MEHTGRITAEAAVMDLPSYQDATTRPDWLALVAPYMRVRDYTRLCLVSRRFYRQFAPPLWNDPLAVLYPGWLLRFMRHVKTRARAITLSDFVRSFDTRCFYGLSTSDAVTGHAGAGGTTPLSVLLFSVTSSFRRLRCILLDGFPNLEPEPPVSPLTLDRLPPFEPPLLLSVARCQVALPPSFFASPYLRCLVYLDVSDMPGSLKQPLAQRTLRPANLPSLRILKSQGRELDNVTATLLFKTFGEQLWSVDLSRNKLTDDALDAAHQFSFPTQRSRMDHYAVEGRIAYLPTGSPSFGRFCTVSESEWSETFSHPHRHIADAPAYIPHGEQGPHVAVAPRLDGRERICSDSADAVKVMLSGRAGSHSPPLGSVQVLDICRAPRAITHLYLNSNNVSATGLARMIRSSPGQLQRLECDSMSFKLPEAAPLSWLSRARLSGTLGWTHVFRPVFSANLQVLRIHHSVVTQLLTLSLDGLSPMANLWVAETQLLPRAELAYPEALVPDMNPRLQSLVLTRIPRYSTGPLIDKLVNFLKLASIQERAIQDTESASRHGPVTLFGLRHIRFEFESDPLEELEDGFDLEEVDLDASAVMEDATKEFSFFGDSGWSSSVPTTANAAPSATPTPSSGPSPAAVPAAAVSAVVDSQPQIFDPHNTSKSKPESELESELRRTSHPSSANASPDGTPATRQKYPDGPDHHPEHPQHHLTHVRIPHSWTWHDDASPHHALIWAGYEYSSHRQEDVIFEGEKEKGKEKEKGEHSAAAGGDGDVPRPPPAVREYARLLRAHPQLRRDPVPATPCHVRGGVPHGELVFGAAWGCILLPLSSRPPSISTSTLAGSSKHASTPAVGVATLPTRAQLRGMRDVVQAIKEYRRQTRRAYEAARRDAHEKGDEQRVRRGAPHFHWGGQLEVEIDGEGARHQSRYWR
ncbi:hypothetical protein C7999DRAFT_40216 [Corynascus novoguineensis]|uniref:Leucine rich repeat domain containing protein n=1 Tax=Corynascus novoguineensis TaxID=1126955 RepID=A0AAN7CWT6_9PEZI|nr:hypothetical protein C7999DRAFT_40216 [Corynascus novoguineensis]